MKGMATRPLLWSEPGSFREAGRWGRAEGPSRGSQATPILSLRIPRVWMGLEGGAGFYSRQLDS